MHSAGGTLHRTGNCSPRVLLPVGDLDPHLTRKWPIQDCPPPNSILVRMAIFAQLNRVIDTYRERSTCIMCSANSPIPALGVGDVAQKAFRIGIMYVAGRTSQIFSTKFH